MKEKAYIPYTEGEKIRVAILFQVPSYWPSIESFYRECLNDEMIEVRIYFVDDLAVERVQMKDAQKFLEEAKLSYEIYSEDRIDEFRPHVALYQPPYDVLYRNPSALSIHLKSKGVRIIYIPYGIEIADTEDARLAHFHTYVVRNAWRIYTFSEKMKEDYQKYCPNRHAVRATGSPKFDAIGRDDIQLNEEIRVAAKGRKIVVWKMHFPKMIYDGMKQLQVTPYLSEYLEFAKKIEEFEDVFFMVMPHPLFFSSSQSNNITETSMQLFEILRKKSNVYIDMSSDYRPSLYNADAIIVDRSALMVEAGLCKVPVLYMHNEDYEEPLTNAVKCLVDTYEQGTHAVDMMLFVEQLTKNGLQDSVLKRQKVIDETMPFLDGYCGKRIVADIKMGIEKENDCRKRVVFFGAGMVCDYYVNKLNILDHDNFKVLGLADNSSSKWGTVHAGMQVMPPENLKELDFDILVITTEQYHMPIKKKLVYELCLDEEKIWRLDTFCEKFYEKWS